MFGAFAEDSRLFGDLLILNIGGYLGNFVSNFAFVMKVPISPARVMNI